MLFSNGASTLSLSRVAESSLANASSVGAITVNWPPFSGSTSFTLGLSLPDTAAVSVVSSGLFEAAVATGSCAMPVTEPGPLGTFSACPLQPVPTRLAGGKAGVVAEDDSGAVMATADELVVALLLEASV